MMEDELIELWKSSSEQTRIRFEKSKLMIELQSSLGRLHRWWNFIERVNVISALITIPTFILIVYVAPLTSMKIASILVIAWSIYVGVRMSSIKKIKPNDFEKNYLQYLEKTKVYLLAQKRLLETSLNWAMLTIYPIVLLFFVDLWDKPLARYIGVTAFLALVGIGIYEHYLSKRRVKNEITPRLDQIDELIKELKE